MKLSILYKYLNLHHISDKIIRFYEDNLTCKGILRKVHLEPRIIWKQMLSPGTLCFFMKILYISINL